MTASHLGRYHFRGGTQGPLWLASYDDVTSSSGRGYEGGRHGGDGQSAGQQREAMCIAGLR
ncbi:hypothetical protein, partial [Streptomyces sp. NPDC057428]|uniref:hypothetical protein n=1 Tax=Streptomyces sp. NPDC057428 TaxID=3346129 RepID=UPI003692AA8F